MLLLLWLETDELQFFPDDYVGYERCMGCKRCVGCGSEVLIVVVLYCLSMFAKQTSKAIIKIVTKVNFAKFFHFFFELLKKEFNLNF